MEKIDNLISNANNKLEIFLNEKFISYSIFEKWVDHLVWKVDFKNRSYVLKVWERVIVDEYVLNILNTINFKSPKIIISYKVDNKKCLVMEFVSWDLICQHKDSIHIYLKQIIIELNILHKNFKYSWWGYMSDHLKLTIWKWSSFLEKLIDKPSNDKNWGNILPTNHYWVSIINKTRDFLKKHINITKERNKSSLLHFDINLSNIIVENSKIKSIIDWSDCRIWDPLYDFARLRLTLEHLWNKDLISDYYNYLNLNEEEKKLEKYYFYHIALEYVYHFHSVNSKKYVDKTLDLLKEI